jgi:hypothetical protein
MKILGAILAVLGILAVAVAAIQHFNPILPPTTPHLSLYIAVVGVLALIVGAVLGRLGGEGDSEA